MYIAFRLLIYHLLGGIFYLITLSVKHFYEFWETAADCRMCTTV